MVGKDPYMIQSVARAIQILETLKKRNTVRPVELADELDVSRAAIHKHLKTLEEFDLIAQGDVGYRLRFGLASFAAPMSFQWELFELARTAIQRLEENIEETVCFVGTEQGEAVYLYVTDTDEAADIEGVHIPLENDPGGRAILAFNPELREGIDDEEVTDELQAIRENGYASGKGARTHNGFKTVAVPVRNVTGSAVAAIAVTGTFDWVTKKRLEEEVISHLTSKSREIERGLTPTDDHPSATRI